MTIPVQLGFVDNTFRDTQKNVVESNIYSGLEAKLKFTAWKKV